jgi:hypothetical protein
MANRNTVMAMAGPSSCQGYSDITPAPSATREPQEARGAETPRPRKDRNDSVMMNCGTMRVENTTMTPRVLGVRWRKMIRAGLAPMERAASTNSACLRLITCPRTTRHRVSQEISATATNRLRMLRPNRAIMMITSSM